MQETEFNPWFRKSLWRSEWQPTPVFLPGESHGQRILAGYSPWDCKESHNWVTSTTPPLWDICFPYMAIWTSVQFSLVTLWDPMDCSMPSLPVHHQLPGFTQTHVHQVSDAIQPSHPLLVPSPPAFNPSQHQGLCQFFASDGQIIGVSASASVLPMNLQAWLPLRQTDLISLQSKGLSRVFSNTTVQNH